MGGIVGGILGTVLLITVAVISYLLGRRKASSKPAATPVQNEKAVENSDFEGIQRGPPSTEFPEEMVCGRLKYPNEEEREGGRLEGRSLMP